MRREMEDEIRAQLEANLDTLGDIQTSWDEKVDQVYERPYCLPCICLRVAKAHSRRVCCR